MPKRAASVRWWRQKSRTQLQNVPVDIAACPFGTSWQQRLRAFGETYSLPFDLLPRRSGSKLPSEINEVCMLRLMFGSRLVDALVTRQGLFRARFSGESQCGRSAESSGGSLTSCRSVFTIRRNNFCHFSIMKVSRSAENFSGRLNHVVKNRGSARQRKPD